MQVQSIWIIYFYSLDHFLGNVRSCTLSPRVLRGIETPQMDTSLIFQYILHRAFHGISSLLNTWGNAWQNPQMVLHLGLLFLP